MPEYGFSLTGIIPYKDRIVDFVLIWKNTCQGKPVFWHILLNVFFCFFAMLEKHPIALHEVSK